MLIPVVVGFGSPKMNSGKATEDDTGAWFLVTLMGDLNGILVFWLPPNAALATAFIWRVNRQMEDLHEASASSWLLPTRYV